jgi:hypothetical protein
MHRLLSTLQPAALIVLKEIILHCQSQIELACSLRGLLTDPAASSE